jgi:hypothetical protein
MPVIQLAIMIMQLPITDNKTNKMHQFLKSVFGIELYMFWTVDNKTNKMHQFLKSVFGIELYMFWTVFCPLSEV